ncbi:hypothetical protein DPEC_G00352980 [Dallia pectoralis]|uniref:Uncharacterized protein n=1 Tax=Dallia pectoralis TaxID=75939 RepID=A0ACC2F2E6_DALPE|nr:hypothetical protein DPEC_G00352980 [Dallia pectoralis]
MAIMHGKEARFCTGCWRLWILVLSSIIVLHGSPLSVHGNTIGANDNELDTKANATSLPNEAVKVDDASDGGTEVGGTEVGGTEVGGTKVGGTKVGGTFSPVGAVTQRADHMPFATQEPGSGMEDPVTTSPSISPDSAEEDGLLLNNTGGTEADEEVEEARVDSPWLNEGDLDRRSGEGFPSQVTITAPPPDAGNPSHPGVLTVRYDSASRGHGDHLASPAPSSLAHELQGDTTSFAVESYDYTAYEEGAPPTPDMYSYSTTTDTVDEDEDGLEMTTRPPVRSPGFGSFNPDERRRSGSAVIVPDSPAGVPVSGSDGAGGCRPGYVMQNGTCRSPCDTTPSYCFNGGQCYLLEGMGVLCRFLHRCNVQDYIWHKGARCESVVTEFQVLCLTIGASALTVLLLFMIIVCFAKKLHVLKTENSKLRKRSSKYRPPSEQHNDNFSLSTIAEGSHPNKTMSRYTWECKTKEEPDCEDDPNIQNKLEDPVKAPVPKEDDSLNIHNSLTPKHENHKVLGEENSSEVNSLQNNMM